MVALVPTFRATINQVRHFFCERYPFAPALRLDTELGVLRTTSNTFATRVAGLLDTLREETAPYALTSRSDNPSSFLMFSAIFSETSVTSPALSDCPVAMGTSPI